MTATQVDIDPDLLDVVPWSYGYAHSWALAALLSDPRTAQALIQALPELPGRRPLTVVGGVAREKNLRPARADLAFTMRDADGEDHQVAVETKVNDAFRADQMAAYAQAESVPVLFLPGVTGLLLAATEPTPAGEIRLLPGALLDALGRTGLTFGRLLGGYLDVLKAESARMDRALTLARGDHAEPVADGRCSAEIVEDVAWLAETYRALAPACAGSAIDPAAEMRIEANDRGIFFAGSFKWVLRGQGGLWVDVMADLRTHKRAVAIKAGERDLAGAWDLAASAADPGPGDGWRRTSRRISGGTATVWKRDLDRAVDARAAAAEAVQAATFIAELTG